MNVLKGTYYSKRKLNNDRRQRTRLRRNFSGFHTVNEVMVPSNIFRQQRNNQPNENNLNASYFDDSNLNSFQELQDTILNYSNGPGSVNAVSKLQSAATRTSLSTPNGFPVLRPGLKAVQDSVLGTSSTSSDTSSGSNKYSVLNLELPKGRKRNIRDDLNIERRDDSRSTIKETPMGKSTSSRGTSSSSKPSSSSTFCRTPKVPAKSPKTPGTGKGHQNTDTGSYIVAVTEGRGNARGEVGIAAMDPKRPHLILCQISDNQRYTHSLTKMNIFNLVEVIVPNTFIEGSTPSKLYSDIRESFPSVTLTSVLRRHFSEALGIEWAKQYCSPESNSVMVILHDKFYALSAASALVKYVEFTQNIIFAPRSVRVEYQGTEDTMLIDLDTANRLELVMSVTPSESTQNSSLFGVVRHCHTRGGTRLLRANILQPSCCLEKIKKRMDCVSELINNPALFNALEAAVSSFSNVENLLTLCMHGPREDGLQVAESQLKYTLLLKTSLEKLPVLQSSMDDANAEYFCEIRENLSDVRFQRILDRIMETIFEDAKTVKGSVAAHWHSCFAIKTGVNSLLDVAKKTYCEIVQEITDHVTGLQEKYDLPIRMSFSGQKGFHIIYTLSPAEKKKKKTDLPQEFILVQKSRSAFTFYTSELVAMDQRSQQILSEIKLMSNAIIYDLMTDIRPDVGCLFNLSEYIAELDVIVSFAHTGSGEGYTRPIFSDRINLKDSRHPILDVISEEPIVPNDMFAEQGKNFIILTGPNQSGKSVYIRQIALLQVMAQIGCYVPASHAEFRLTDRLFSRIGFDDSIESNASTLTVEMKDIGFIRQNLGSNSIVIIDELCRGTSVEEGTTLAFAICEEFIDSSAFVFLTTHYLFLTKLEELYMNVSNFNFETKIEVRNSGASVLKFSHKRVPGVTNAESYGLQAAELTSFPTPVLNEARRLAQVIMKERKPLREVNGLVSLYELSQTLKLDISKMECSVDFCNIEPLIRRCKVSYLEMTKQKDLSEIDSVISELIHNGGKHRMELNDADLESCLPEPENLAFEKECDERSVQTAKMSDGDISACKITPTNTTVHLKEPVSVLKGSKSIPSLNETGETENSDKEAKIAEMKNIVRFDTKNITLHKVINYDIRHFFTARRNGAVPVNSNDSVEVFTTNRNDAADETSNKSEGVIPTERMNGDRSPTSATKSNETKKVTKVAKRRLKMPSKTVKRRRVETCLMKRQRLKNTKRGKKQRSKASKQAVKLIAEKPEI